MRGRRGPVTLTFESWWALVDRDADGATRLYGPFGSEDAALAVYHAKAPGQPWTVDRYQSHGGAGTLRVVHSGGVVAAPARRNAPRAGEQRGGRLSREWWRATWRRAPR